MRYLLILASFFISGIKVFPQTKLINSLKIKVDAANSNDEKLAAIVAYCEDYANINQDSLEKYTYIALDLASKSKDKRLQTLAQLTLAQDYMKWGWTDSVRAVVDNELKNNAVTDDARRDIYFRLKKLKALAFAADGRFEESLNVLYPLDAESTKYADTSMMGSTADLIGKIAISRNELREARKWNDKALSVFTKGNTKNLPSIFINRGQLYYKEKKMDSALFFLNKGLTISKENDMFDNLARGYRYQSVVLTKMNKLTEAEDALRNMQEARSKMYSSQDAVIDDNIQIAEFYANTGQLKKAIAFCWSKLETGDIYHKNPGDSTKTFNIDPATRLPFYLALARYLKEDKDFESYQKVLEEIIVLKDTLSKVNKAEAIAELQTKYDVQHKENTIIAQQLKLTRRNTLLFGSLAFIVLAGLFTWFWIRNVRTQQRLKMQQAIEDEKKLSAQSILDAEEKERKRIAADLHDNIGAYATAISADVEKIKTKGFTESDIQLQNLQQHSSEISNSLRDTIWVLNKENITVTGISDRIKSYINKIDSSYEQQIEVKEKIEKDVRVGSQKALNIFRIVQEAIHNALKHSNAKNILVEIESNDTIRFTVSDNGKGMDLANPASGHGLRNMQARANDAGIQLTVHSLPGQGTRLIIESTTN